MESKDPYYGRSMRLPGGILTTKSEDEIRGRTGRSPIYSRAERPKEDAKATTSLAPKHFHSPL